MKKILLIFILIVINHFLSQGAKAQDWKNIIPLGSTCEKVKKVFGLETCKFPITRYESPNYNASIYFCDKNCDPRDKNGKSLKVAAKSVKAIYFRLNIAIRLSDYKDDLSDYVIKADGDSDNSYYYINDKTGVELTIGNIYDEKVILNVYIYSPKRPL